MYPHISPLFFTHASHVFNLGIPTCSFCIEFFLILMYLLIGLLLLLHLALENPTFPYLLRLFLEFGANQTEKSILDFFNGFCYLTSSEITFYLPHLWLSVTFIVLGYSINYILYHLTQKNAVRVALHKWSVFFLHLKNIHKTPSPPPASALPSSPPPPMPITSDPPSPSYHPRPHSHCRCCCHCCFPRHPPPFLVDCCMLLSPTIICAAALVAVTPLPLSPLLPSPSSLSPSLSCTTGRRGGEVAIAVVIGDPQRHLLKWVCPWCRHPYPLHLPPPPPPPLPSTSPPSWHHRQPLLMLCLTVVIGVVGAIVVAVAIVIAVAVATVKSIISALTARGWFDHCRTLCVSQRQRQGHMTTPCLGGR